MSSSAPAPVDLIEPPSAPKNGLDRFFKISERGSSVGREIRGGFATFFAMAYIIVLNPIILGSAKDMYGHQLDNGQLVTATALTAAFTTLLMGVIGNVPIALAMRPRREHRRRPPARAPHVVARRDGHGGPRGLRRDAPGGDRPA